MAHDVVIVGAGLAGLHLARALIERGGDVVVLEARDRFGGRMRTEPGAHGGHFDLGPAWLWPHQVRLLALAEQLRVPVFDQHVAGKTVFQDARGQVRRDLDLAPMAGSLRLDGGYGRLVAGLVEKMPPERLHRGAAVTGVERTTDGVSVHLGDGRQFAAARVAFAMPPRQIATLAFEPTVPDVFVDRLRAIPTWMAASAKLIATYPTPFWRERGLSGEGLSHRGPLVEVHDASSADGSAAALFGFFGVPPATRRDHADELRDLALRQLAEMVGPEALEPREVRVVDWAFDPHTATADDVAEASRPMHPEAGALPSLGEAWSGVLEFAGSEFACDEPGYAEGALQASEAVFERIVGRR